MPLDIKYSSKHWILTYYYC